MTHSQTYLAETSDIARLIDAEQIEKMVKELVALRERKGRLFVIGLGGSAANASHAVNDFRKLCGIEAYAPTDNVAELTARANDEGWPFIFGDWLQFATSNDAIFILSVGGGSETVSRPIVNAIAHCIIKNGGIHAKILAIVGRNGGHTAMKADCCLIIPTVEPFRVTPHTEGWQSVVLHCLVSHPDLQRNATKW